MQLFDLIPDDFFKPLAGANRRTYIDIVAMLWERCKRSPIYGDSKSMVLDWVEDYFCGLQDAIAWDPNDEIEADESIESGGLTPRQTASAILRRLKATGWIEERTGGYDEEPSVVINQRIVPIIRAFSDIVTPQLTTYKGKLFKIYKLLQSISEADSPYESVLREVSGDLDDLNASLRQLAASIGEYMDELTRGKTPEEILQLFDEYEDKVVVGAYHRFKTNDNLFYYKSELLDLLAQCRTKYYEALIRDFSNVEQVSEEDASLSIGKLIYKLEEDLAEMSEVMKVIDERHILYRTRAVQRAQFLLLSDGTVKSKINRILQYSSETVETQDDLFDWADSSVGQIFQLFPQGYIDYGALKTPTQSRRPTPITEMAELEEFDPEVFVEKQKQLFQYIRSAVTAENVNHFAQNILTNREATTAKALVEQFSDTDDIVKIIGLHTYSSSGERVYDIQMKPNVICCNGLKFQDFTIQRRR